MISFLLGVPGKLKALRDDYTTARAAKIDNLDAAISSRAASATALSNVDYTAARAAKLDNIIATTVINSIQSGSVNDLAGSAGAGLDAYYRDVAIAAVVVAKSVVLINGVSNDSGAFSYLPVAARLTSTTNLRISGYNSHFSCAWQVVEFK